MVDRLTIANGVPDGLNWQEAIGVAIAEASRFSKGTGSLNNGQYSLEGMAKSAEAYDSLVAGMALPAGLTAGERNIRRPLISPYVWSFENPEGSAPTLSGYVPEEGDAAANIAQIEARLGTASAVSNGLEIGAGAPVNLKGATSVAIQAVSRLVNGKAEISGTDLMVSGEALSEIAAAEIRAQIENGVPPGFAGKHDISVRQASSLPLVAADECQTLLTDELAGNSIQFETNKSLIKDTSYGLLDRLSFYVKRCPTANVEISGHTDADGSDEYNQALSEDRANAVRAYLVRSGVFVGRLKAKGFGEIQPDWR